MSSSGDSACWRPVRLASRDGLEKEPLLDEVEVRLDKAWAKTKGVVPDYFHQLVKAPGTA